jgi:hypothetical protein
VSDRQRPPPKKNGDCEGHPRRLDGAILDVRACAAFLGTSEKLIRARAARKCLPVRHWGGRLIFLRAELEEFLRMLDGVSSTEAAENDRRQQG